MLWLLLGLVVLVAVGFLVLRSRGGRWARPPEGVSVGTWTLVADPAARTVAWSLPFSDAVKADFAVHFAQWQLFYFGNGSAAADQSGDLRAGLRALLADVNACPWTVASDVGRGPDVLELSATFSDPNGFTSFPGVLGVRRKGESLVGATLAVVQLGLRLPTTEAARVRTGIESILAWHEQDGPAGAMNEIGPRAYAAMHPKPA